MHLAPRSGDPLDRAHGASVQLPHEQDAGVQRPRALADPPVQTAPFGLGEDPWERLRLLKAAMPNTRMQMLLRGQNMLGYRHYADDVVERFVERSAENGMDVFRIFDAMNDVRNLQTAIRATLKTGKHAQGTLSYTVSPVHTIAGYVDMAKQLEDLGCHSICIKDMAGLLKPYVAFELVSKPFEDLLGELQLRHLKKIPSPPKDATLHTRAANSS